MINITLDKNGNGSVTKSLSDANALKFVQAYGYKDTVSGVDEQGEPVEVPNPETPPQAFVRILVGLLRNGIRTTNSKTREEEKQAALAADDDAISI